MNAVFPNIQKDTKINYPQQRTRMINKQNLAINKTIQPSSNA
jgi:hypothetical protein